MPHFLSVLAHDGLRPVASAVPSADLMLFQRGAGDTLAGNDSAAMQAAAGAGAAESADNSEAMLLSLGLGLGLTPGMLVIIKVMCIIIPSNPLV